MKKLITLILFLVTTGLFAQATGDYRSFSSGTWATAANWERFNGSTWVTAPSAPALADGVITILNTHTMTIAANVGSLDQLVINSGGQITLNSSITMTLANGTGTDLDNSGTFLNIGAVTWTGTQVIQNAGTYIHNTSGSFGNAIGATTCNTGSTIIIRGSSSINAPISISNRTFYNLTLESSSGAWTPTAGTGGNPLTINGNFSIGATGAGTVSYSFGSFTGITTIVGDLNVGSNGTFTIGNSSSLTHRGNLINNGTLTLNAGPVYTFDGTTTISGSTTTNFAGGLAINSSRSVTLSRGITVPTTKTATVSGTLDCGNLTVSGAGTFTLASGGTLKIGSTAGITTVGNATGNIQTTTARNFNTGANYEFTSGSAQVPGNAFPATVNNLTLSGAGGVTFSIGLSVAGIANIGSSSTLTLGTNTLTGTGSASFDALGTGTISLDALSQVSGFTNSFGGTYSLTGSNPNVPAGTYGTLTVGSGGATMTGNVVVTGTLNLNGTYNVGANTLTISNVLGGTATNLTTTSSSSLVVTGNAANIHIPSTVTALTNLTIGNNQVITADANITVSGTYTQTNGILIIGQLEIGQSTVVVGNFVYTPGNGSIRGAIKRWFDNAAFGVNYFPLDNGAGSLALASINFTGSPGVGGFLLATFQNTGSGVLPLGPNGIDRYIVAPGLGVNLINIAPQYWTVSNTGMSGFTYTAEFTGASIIPNLSNLAYVAPIKRDGGDWAYVPGSYVASGSVANPVFTLTGLTSFSDFGVAGNQDNLLPVELASFTSTVSGTNVTLNWSTSMETNNSGFDVERKSTTTGWTKIGNVAGHGTVNTPNTYSYSDRSLASGRYSYRLKQVDFNGNYKYYDLSNEVIVGTPTKYTLAQNFPNPFNPSTSISYEIPATNFVSLKIYDMMGKEVANLVNGTQEAGFYTVKFDASKLSSGIYFYKLQSNDFTATKKLMLLK